MYVRHGTNKVAYLIYQYISNFVGIGL